MAQPISDPRVFYVSMVDPNGNLLYEAANPLAHEVTIAKLDDGHIVCSWFDLANQSMRSIEALSYEHPDQNSYRIKDLYGAAYLFDFVDRAVYENHLHPLLPGSPETFDTDDEVQRFLLKGLIEGP